MCDVPLREKGHTLDLFFFNSVPIEILTNCPSVYQNAIKAAKVEYMSDIVSNKRDKPQVLFNMFNSWEPSYSVVTIVPFLDSLLVKSLLLDRPFPAFYVPGSDPTAPSVPAILHPASLKMSLKLWGLLFLL